MAEGIKGGIAAGNCLQGGEEDGRKGKMSARSQLSKGGGRRRKKSITGAFSPKKRGDLTSDSLRGLLV